jgi:predicted porin
MQKKLIALAVAGAAAAFASAPVMAQSSVTVYGVIDQAITSSNGDGGNGSVTTLMGSGYTTERLGFKGSEDLGNGLKANFELEEGFNSANGYNDVQAGVQQWQRQSIIGLSGANWGQVNFGRQYTPVFSIQAQNSIFRVAGVADNYALTSTGMTRASNSIRYDSPNFNGFSVAAMYSFGDTGTGSASTASPKELGRHSGLNLKYSNGPLDLAYGYGQQYGAAAPSVKTKANILIGSYDFKVVKINAGYQTDKNDANPETVDHHVWNVGAEIPVFGADTVKLSYTKYVEKLTGATSADADLVGLGYVHPMSKRTVLYANYARMTNETNAAKNLAGGAQLISAAGNDPSAFQIGLSHNF